MFVPHEPQLCFDVVRHNDRCVVCGASAVLTYSEGIDRGYCVECAPKRKKFIDKIIGNIEVEPNSTNMAICTIEQMRKNILQERFCYMIDNYFVSHVNEPFFEPYENPSFIEELYREKICLMNDFILPAFTTYVSSNRKNQKRTTKIEKQYNDYYERLTKMLDDDNEQLEEAMYVRSGVHSYTYSLKHDKRKK